ncbi:MAG: hypothetical protein GXO66_08010 [Euryarchaeota archaeon]|nr:hypothetical protein [Euryarchaeota archaeon]
MDLSRLPFDIRSIKPGEFAYLTKRKLKNREGEEKGEIILWKRRGSEESEFLLHCPFCGEENSGKVVLKRRPYRVRCPSCNRSITLPKLADQAKRESS